MSGSPPTTVGHYRLLSRLGAGGTGDVWRAHDSHLDREVAIKLLNSGALTNGTARDRFRHEAHVLSRLSHAGVATIFDFDTQDGVDFLVMEFVPGGTLEERIEASGALPIAEVCRLGAAIADALHVAHTGGFLHRDLKPGNIVLTEQDLPKILDFGLAILLDRTKRTARITQTGMIVGSLPYMAPEQLLGDADDARTDIYALGVMLFEMATGRRPFVKERTEALMFEIVNNAPPSLRGLRPDAPAELDRLIIDCLSKDQDRRPASAADVAGVLRVLGSGEQCGAMLVPARLAVRAMAVLPLRNLSGNPAQEYFADGMTEAIISHLARIRELRVISRTSAMQYKHSEKSLPQIARELNVDVVLEGSVLLLDDRVRLSVHLISARADDMLWAEHYDRQLTDVLALQTELAESVVREIAIQVTPAEATRLAERVTANPDAQLEYLMGRHAYFGGSPQAIEIALRHCRRALELDPNLAAAWACISDCHELRATRGMAPPAEAFEEGMSAANQALAIDPSLAEAHVALGSVLCYTGQLEAGTNALRRAIVLNPGLSLAYNRLGLALYAVERHAEATAAMSMSVQLDPLSMLRRLGAGDAHYYAREYEKSVFHYRMAIELDARFDGAHTDLARSLVALGRFDEAREEYEQGLALSGGIAGPSFGMAHLEAASGNVTAARRILRDLTAARNTRVVSAWGIAVVHASLGDVDEAFRWLQTAIAERASGLILLRVHPRLDPIRGDRRHWSMIERLGLATG